MLCKLSSPSFTMPKEYGSILTITPQDWDALYARFDEVADESSFHRESIRKKLLPLVRVAQTLAQKYDVVLSPIRPIWVHLI